MSRKASPPAGSRGTGDACTRVNSRASASARAWNSRAVRSRVSRTCVPREGLSLSHLARSSTSDALGHQLGEHAACSYRSRAWGGLPGAAASAPRSPAASSPRSYPCDGPAPHRPVSEAARAPGIRCQLGEQNTDTSPFSTFEVFEARIKHAPHRPSVLHPSVERLRAEPASLAELLCFCPLRHQALFLLLSFLPHLSERSHEPNIRRTRLRPCMQGEETLSVRAGHGGKRGARILTQQSKN